MKPFFFNLDSGLSLIILPENKSSDTDSTYTFQLYNGDKRNMGNSLNDLNNYAGLISFDWASQEFYYTPGNLSISSAQILELIALIKTKIY
jgi:hypothetical protein